MSVQTPRISRFTERLGLPIARVFAAVAFFLLGPLRVIGKKNFPKGGAVLILSNHQSDIDPVLVYAACPRPVYYMAKSELFAMPLVAKMMRPFRPFPVKRGEPDRDAIKTAVAYLHEQEVVGVFPEGRLSEDGQLLELKPGIALIVRMAKCPVICCGVQNSNRIIPFGSRLPRPSFRRVTVTWGKPASFEAHASTEEIMEWVESELRRLIDQPKPSSEPSTGA